MKFVLQVGFLMATSSSQTSLMLACITPGETCSLRMTLPLYLNYAEPYERARGGRGKGKEEEEK